MQLLELENRVKNLRNAIVHDADDLEQQVSRLRDALVRDASELANRVDEFREERAAARE